MKKIILIAVLFIATGLQAQLDPPSGYTSNFKLRLYDEGDHPGADSVNRNLIDIDLAIKNGYLKSDSTKNRFNVLHNTSGTLKDNVVTPNNVTSTFFEQYFVRYTGGIEAEPIWKLRVDVSQIDNDTIKIKDGVFGKISGTNTWTGTNSFNAEQTNYGNGTSVVINYQIANDIGSIEWKKNNSTTLAKWDEDDGNYWQFMSSIDVTGDVSLSGVVKPGTKSDASASINSLFIGSDHSNQLCWKDGAGTVHVLY